mgnify:CR=1 FL=1
MSMNPHIFREYDIRGIADTDLNDEAVTRIGQAYGTLMARRGHRKIAVGRDVRLTSERIQDAITRGVTSAGIDVVQIGQVTTPITYFSIVHLNLDGSVMVTGSHNPIEYNGLKMNEGLMSVYGQDIQEILRLIQTEDLENGQGTVTQMDVVPAYKAMLKERIRLHRSFKVVIDAGNGTAGPVAPEVLRELGCEVICMYCEPDGRFPNHLPDPTVLEYIQDLRDRVVAEGADIGLGYDGDSDRIGVVDHLGRVIFADQIIALLARDVLSRHKGAEILFDVKCSQMLPEEIEKAGGRPVMWKTGHSLLKAKMQETGAPFAGEMSGHIFFKDGFFGFDDGIYVSFRLIQYLSEQEKTLAELVDELPKYHSTPEIRITCRDEEKFTVVRKLTEEFKKDYRVIDVDGARVEFGDGWGLVRVSNTQPVLVLRFEAKTEKRLQEIRDLFRKKLSAFPAVKVEEMEGGSGGH